MTHKRLRHVAQVNPSSPGFDRLPEDAEVSFLRMESVWPGKWRELSEVKKKHEVISGFTRFQDGDILVPKITPTFEASRSILVDGLKSGAGAGTTELHVVRSGGEIYPRFLMYVMHSHGFLRLGESEMYGVAGQKRVPDSFLRDFIVWDPGVDEQRRIADFLDAEVARIDQVRELSRRQSVLSIERFIELMRTSTSVGVGQVCSTAVPWMPEMNASWDLMKISRNFLVGGGTTPKSSREEYFSGVYPWVNSADVMDGDIVSTDKRVSRLALIDYPSLVIHPSGSLVIALYGQGATKGRVGILRVDACVNQACCVLRPSGGLLAEYAYFWFRGHKSGVIGLAVGAGQPNLSQELIKDLRIPAPGLTEQKDIVARLQEAEAEFVRRKNILGRRENLLEERKRALITAAVTGQIDVTTARGADLS